MRLLRPPNRVVWWLAFLGSIVLLPVFLVLVSLMPFGVAGPILYPVGLLSAPLPGCYLIGIARLPLFIKVVLVPLVYCAVVFVFLPRANCGEDGSSTNNQVPLTISSRGGHGCRS